MPILAAEADVYPSTLLDEPIEACSTRRWWVVYTKARQEKSLARELLKYQVPFYLPLVGRDHRLRGSVVRSYIPLFTGYVFLYGDEDERVRSLTTNRTSRILPVDEQEQLWSDLRQLRRLIESNAPLTVESRLVAGQRVRVRDGLLAGIEGVVLARRRLTRLLVAVNMLGQGVSAEIDDFMLEPIDP